MLDKAPAYATKVETEVATVVIRLGPRIRLGRRIRLGPAIRWGRPGRVLIYA